MEKPIFIYYSHHEINFIKKKIKKILNGLFKEKMKLTRDEKKFMAALIAKGSMVINEATQFWATPGYEKKKLKRLEKADFIRFTESMRIIPAQKEDTLKRWLM